MNAHVTSRYLLPICLAILPHALPAQSSEEKAELPDLAADALADEAGGPGRVRGLELSGSYRKAGGAAMCATTDAFDSNGNFIGLTYWQIIFDAEGGEVKSLTNVTGLNSTCYSETYKGYRY